MQISTKCQHYALQLHSAVFSCAKTTEGLLIMTTLGHHLHPKKTHDLTV